jgi:hypothetical protein
MRIPLRLLVARVVLASNKVPEATLVFWSIKILATTVGETGADYLAVHFGLRAALTDAIMAVLLLAALAAPLRMSRYVNSERCARALHMNLERVEKGGWRAAGNRLCLRAFFRLEPIQISKQMLDLRRLRFGQPKFVLYALQPPAPICRL